MRYTGALSLEDVSSVVLKRIDLSTLICGGTTARINGQSSCLELLLLDMQRPGWLRTFIDCLYVDFPTDVWGSLLAPRPKLDRKSSNICFYFCMWCFVLTHSTMSLMWTVITVIMDYPMLHCESFITGTCYMALFVALSFTVILIMNIWETTANTVCHIFLIWTHCPHMLQRMGKHLIKTKPSEIATKQGDDNDAFPNHWKVCWWQIWSWDRIVFYNCHNVLKIPFKLFPLFQVTMYCTWYGMVDAIN